MPNSPNKVLLVTGGGRGIGAAIVRLAVQRGYAVCFTYVQDEASANQLTTEINSTGNKVMAVRADVADPDAICAFFDQAERAFGPVSALVNNAGITGRIGRFDDATTATMRRVVEVNLLGTMFCAQEALRRWQQHERIGNIVNISSVAAATGAAGEYVHYAASKAAVETFTIGLAREVAESGTRINAVAPGTVHTGIHAAAGEPNRPQRVVSRIPMARIGEPNEIANAVLWLLSDEASYVTGTVLHVSGGI